MASIERHIDAKIGLVFVLLDVILVRPSQHAPVDVFGIVSDSIGFVVCEFRTWPLQWASVRTGEIPLHHIA